MLGVQPRPRPREEPASRAWRRRPREWRLLLPAMLLLGLALAALAAPWLAPYSPAEQFLEQRLEGPRLNHLLGLDELGRDILSRLLHGARISLWVGLSVVVGASLLGSILGAVAGYRGGWLDSAIMRLADAFLAFPGILLAIAMVAVLGPSLNHLVLALVVIGWVGYARLARAQVLKIRREEFVTAARAAGAPASRILIRHVFPHLLPLLAVQASLGMAGAILSEAGLSFLGLGVQPPTPSWGAMINAGRAHLLDAPHVALFPGLAIVLTVLALNFLGDALADRTDPKRSELQPPTGSI